MQKCICVEMRLGSEEMKRQRLRERKKRRWGCSCSRVDEPAPPIVMGVEGQGEGRVALFIKNSNSARRRPLCELSSFYGPETWADFACPWKKSQHWL